MRNREGGRKGGRGRVPLVWFGFWFDLVGWNVVCAGAGGSIWIGEGGKVGWVSE